jgi:hypothetical protein
MANAFFNSIEAQKLKGGHPRGDHIQNFVDSHKQNLNSITE